MLSLPERLQGRLERFSTRQTGGCFLFSSRVLYIFHLYILSRDMSRNIARDGIRPPSAYEIYDMTATRLRLIYVEGHMRIFTLIWDWWLFFSFLTHTYRHLPLHALLTATATKAMQGRLSFFECRHQALYEYRYIITASRFSLMLAAGESLHRHWLEKETYISKRELMPW